MMWDTRHDYSKGPEMNCTYCGSCIQCYSELVCLESPDGEHYFTTYAASTPPNHQESFATPMTGNHHNKLDQFPKIEF